MFFPARNRTLAIFAIFGAILSGCAAHRDHRTEARPAQPAAPADELLANLVGDWHITRQMKSRTVESTMSVRPVLGGKFVQMHMLDASQPPKYEALVLVGLDPERHDYVIYWCDSFGPEYSAAGRGTRTDNSIEFAFQFKSGGFFNTFRWNPEERTWTFRGENASPDGTRRFFMEDLARPAKPAS